jgi:predicted transcriptional regulator of viral defense system
MDNVTVLKLLESKQSAVFTTQQLALLLKMDTNAVAVKLNRLVKKGVLLRILRGRYTLPSTPILAVASSLYHPSYVSLLAAFEHYGTTTQSPRVIDVINPIHSGQLQVNIETGRFLVRFIQLVPSLMYGYTKTYLGGTAALIAEKEKAIVDGLLLSEYIPLDEVAASIQSGIDHKKILDYGMRTKRQTVMKRLGYLLSEEGIACSPNDFGTLSKTYVPLDPKLPRRGKHDQKWHVIINRVIE